MRDKFTYRITADSHFGHDKLIEYSARPENFTQRIMKNHLDLIKENDVLIHLGDFCIGRDEHWHHEFFKNNSSKNWLVKGNHDRCTNNWYFRHGWSVVCDSLHMKVFGMSILFTHRPVNVLALDALGCDVNIHGHLHSNIHRIEDEDYNLLTPRHILVTMEGNYKPIDLRKLLNK